MTFRSSSKGATGSNGVTTLSFAWPAGIAVGDLVVLAGGLQAVAGGDNPMTAPGFTLRANHLDAGSSSTRPRLNVWTRVIDGTEDPQITINVDSTAGLPARVAGVAAAYTGEVLGSESPVITEGTSTNTDRVFPSITTNGTRRLVEMVADPSGATAVLTPPPGDVLRNSQPTSNVGVHLMDTGDVEVAAGSYSKTASSTGSTSAYVTAVITLDAAPTGSTPTLTVSQPVPGVIKAVGTADAGGALTYSISQVSGTTQTPVVIEDGIWGVIPDTGELVYDVTVTEAGGGSATSRVIVEAAGAGDTAVAAGYQWDGATLRRVM